MKNLTQTDKQIANLIKVEEIRQKTSLQMIPSENLVSGAVREAEGSVLTNKYSEGYPFKRYYQGNVNADQIETIAIERAKKLFGVPHANVQPYSGSQANMAVLFALLKRGDTILGMSLTSGGHLTHGHPKVTFSGKYFKSVQYSVGKNGFIDYQEIERLALKYRPKIIISGSTAYPRIINFKKFGQIAEKVGAYHLADIAHIAGLVVGGQHLSPVRYSDLITTTTQKTLRGPRGAMILVTKKGLKKNPELAEKIDKAVFPGIQGGPHNQTTAAIAVCLKEASSPKFKTYAKNVVHNCYILAEELKKYGFNLLTNGTDNHLILIDLTNKGTDGWAAAKTLEIAGIIVNKNTIPGEKGTAYYPSGIRLGTPFITSQGFKEKDMKKVAKWINQIIDTAKNYDLSDRRGFKEFIAGNEALKKIKSEVKASVLAVVRA